MQVINNFKYHRKRKANFHNKIISNIIKKKEIKKIPIFKEADKYANRGFGTYFLYGQFSLNHAECYISDMPSGCGVSILYNYNCNNDNDLLKILLHIIDNIKLSILHHKIDSKLYPKPIELFNKSLHPGKLITTLGKGYKKSYDSFIKAGFEETDCYINRAHYGNTDKQYLLEYTFTDEKLGLGNK